MTLPYSNSNGVRLFLALDLPVLQGSTAVGDASGCELHFSTPCTPYYYSILHAANLSFELFFRTFFCWTRTMSMDMHIVGQPTVIFHLPVLTTVVQESFYRQRSLAQIFKIEVILSTSSRGRRQGITLQLLSLDSNIRPSKRLASCFLLASQAADKTMEHNIQH